MQYYVKAYLLITVIFFAACNPPVTFNKAQPIDSQPLGSFPTYIQGRYLDADSASVLCITNNLITRHCQFDYKQHKDSLDKNYTIMGDSILDIVNHTKQKIKQIGDSISLHTAWTDTLFQLSGTQLVKKYKGYYFLNIMRDENMWEVKMLFLKNGLLHICCINQENELHALKELTATSSDTIATNFIVTRKQFTQFVKQSGFKDHEIFKRLQ